MLVDVMYEGNVPVLGVGMLTELGAGRVYKNREDHFTIEQTLGLDNEILPVGAGEFDFNNDGWMDFAVRKQFFSVIVFSQVIV